MFVHKSKKAYGVYPFGKTTKLTYLTHIELNYFYSLLGTIVLFIYTVYTNEIALIWDILYEGHKFNYQFFMLMLISGVMGTALTMSVILSYTLNSAITIPIIMIIRDVM